jgi:hypothetical protein
VAIDTSIRPTAKVAASTAALAVVSLAIALIEWLAGIDVPASVEIPLEVIATFAAGYFAPREDQTGGRHVG